MKSKIIITLLAVALLSACSKDNTTGNNTNNNSSGTTHVQFINASPSALAPSLYVPGSSAPQVSDFYYYIGTGYDQPNVPGLIVTIKGGTNNATELTSPLTCSKDSFYNWFLYDTFPNLKGYLTTNVRTTAPAGMAMVKFVNVSPNAGTIGYRIKGQTSLLSSNLAYAGSNPSSAASAYIPVATGYPAIEVLDMNTSQVIDSVAQNTFLTEAGHYYTVFTTAYKGGPGLNQIVTLPTEDH